MFCCLRTKKNFFSSKFLNSEAGIFARDIKLPEWDIKWAATNSPIIIVKFGVLYCIILFLKYFVNNWQYSFKNII